MTLQTRSLRWLAFSFSEQRWSDHFDRAYAARLAAGHTIPVGRGVWVALSEEEGTSPIQRVGAGAGIAHPAVGRVLLECAAA